MNLIRNIDRKPIRHNLKMHYQCYYICNQSLELIPDFLGYQPILTLLYDFENLFQPVSSYLIISYIIISFEVHFLSRKRDNDPKEVCHQAYLNIPALAEAEPYAIQGSLGRFIDVDKLIYFFFHFQFAFIITETCRSEKYIAFN